jgi:CheY-like chemotaxis protein
VVEPDADTRELYAFVLQQNQWRVAVARDGREGLAQALALRPNVVVSELALPGVDGAELCRRLRDEPATRQIPILIVTASAYPADLHRASAAGGDAVLSKPCLPTVLIERVRGLCEEGRSAQAILDEVRPRPVKADLDPAGLPGVVPPRKRLG